MANPTVSITWTYSTDPLVQAALGGFDCYAIDANGNRILPAVIVPKGATMAATIPMPGYGKQTVEVVPVDLQGTEGVKTDKAVYIALPAVTSISQVLV